MSEKKVLICDACGKDCITYSSYPAKYSFELKSINTNINNTGATFAVVTTPAIPDAVHFCTTKCLLTWVNNRFGDKL